MPYIPQERRKQISMRMGLGDLLAIKTPGELNYTLAKHIDIYLSVKPKLGYTEFNEVIGVLESLKMEVYRRIVSPYEDVKMKENGDVFDTGH